ncbi:MAG: hypothetical protein N4A35_03880 [Flavobacteriales bacterium]|jgi:hypothetical protein|nr:hypothetical protein [Flavobacteriales bacterium]
MLDQHNNHSSTLLYTLCILTIVGSIFTMARAFLYEIVSMIDNNSDYYRGWIYGLTSVGTLIGAVLMIQKLLIGLYVYSIAQVLYIITVILAVYSYQYAFGPHDNNSIFIATTIALIFLIPSIIFLVLYWTNMIKKHLS